MDKCLEEVVGKEMGEKFEKSLSQNNWWQSTREARNAKEVSECASECCVKQGSLWHRLMVRATTPGNEEVRPSSYWARRPHPLYQNASKIAWFQHFTERVDASNGPFPTRSQPPFVQAQIKRKSNVLVSAPSLDTSAERLSSGPSCKSYRGAPPDQFTARFWPSSDQSVNTEEALAKVAAEKGWPEFPLWSWTRVPFVSFSKHFAHSAGPDK